MVLIVIMHIGGFTANQLLLDLDPSELHKMHDSFNQLGGTVNVSEVSDNKLRFLYISQSTNIS